MPRPRKCRKVCQMPPVDLFTANGSEEDEFITLTIDEYESLRLIDYRSLSQEACAEYMQVSRATIQLVYDSARKKVATALVNGVSLRIAGGDYRLCDGNEEYCECGGCPRHTFKKYDLEQKGEHIMRIAVPYENGQVFQKFGHAARLKVYDVEEKNIVKEIIIDTNGHGRATLLGALKAVQADTVICGEIGENACAALKEAGIRLFPGVTGNADEAVAALAEGNLAVNLTLIHSCKEGGHHGQNGGGDCQCHKHEGEEGHHCCKDEGGEGHHCRKEEGGEGHHCCKDEGGEGHHCRKEEGGEGHHCGKHKGPGHHCRHHNGEQE